MGGGREGGRNRGRDACTQVRPSASWYQMNVSKHRPHHIVSSLASCPSCHDTTSGYHGSSTVTRMLRLASCHPVMSTRCRRAASHSAWTGVAPGGAAPRDSPETRPRQQPRPCWLVQACEIGERTGGGREKPVNPGLLSPVLLFLSPCTAAVPSHHWLTARLFRHCSVIVVLPPCLARLKSTRFRSVMAVRREAVPSCADELIGHCVQAQQTLVGTELVAQKP